MTNRAWILIATDGETEATFAMLTGSGCIVRVSVDAPSKNRDTAEALTFVPEVGVVERWSAENVYKEPQVVERKLWSARIELEEGWKWAPL